MFITLLLSYLGVFLIPVIIGSVVYVRIEQIMIDNAYRSNAALLEQMKHVMDGRTQEIDNLMHQIVFHPKAELLLDGSADTAREQYPFFEFMKELSRYSAFNNLLYDFYIYFVEADSIITTTLKTDPVTFYHQIYKDLDRTFDQYKQEVLLGPHTKTYLPVQLQVNGLKKERKIAYMQSLPLGERDDVTGNLVILIDDRQLRDTLMEIEGLHDGDIYIYSGEHQLLLGPEESLVSAEVYLNRLKDGQSAGFFDDSEVSDQFVAYTVSAKNGWTYLSVFPKSVVLEQVNDIKRWSLLTVLLCVLAGIGACVYLTRKQYGPIRDVVRMIGRGAKGSEATNANEVELIRHTLEELFGEENRLQEKLRQQLPTLRADFLSRLIRGQVDADSITAQDLNFMGIAFEEPWFRVLVMELQYSEGFMRQDSEREWALVRFVLMNLCRDLLDEQGYAFETEKNRIVVLWNKTDDREDMLHEVNGFSDSVVRTMAARFKTTISIGIGGAKHGFAQIAEGYDEAMLALSYRMVASERSILHYNEVLASRSGTYRFPMDTEVQLVNYVKNGDEGNAIRLLDQLHELNFKHEDLSPDMAQYLYMELNGTLLKAMDQLRLDYRQFFSEEQGPPLALDESATAAELHERIKGRFVEACRSVKEDRTDYSKSLYQEMVQYLEEHYPDNNLSLTMLADRFNRNPVYVSSFFKKHGGENVTDVLTRIRVGGAKQLLMETDLTVNEIALRVGYSNNIVLTKVFKKLEGITPGSFREQARKSQD
ncbi:helix-turn-helix domain-containing protein [Paenibacillus arenilitoris]|uniref:Helix-turn-helix domain-containing protein n=1 Tax=Paenibacillus arenilitoris TaxID=2772299 RepID=A0A927H7W2_9BACL|nr:helix-turn-helix domain-containing protein [Paenibacillus arenilitoris]MBD2871068.1 helix-turn-helix domain-containing protein [Paenibacillus arenilitoris]